MDQTDLIIIEELKRNSKITMKELGEIVHLSGQAVSNRVIKLEESGVIKGYTIDIEYQKCGYPVHAILNIYTKNLTRQSYLTFLKLWKDNIIHNYKISGDSCYLLDCHFSSNEALDNFLVELNKYVGYKLNIIISE